MRNPLYAEKGLPAQYQAREALALEVHARPPESLQAPLAVSHIAMLSGEHGADRDLQHLQTLCARHGAAQPAQGAAYHSVDLGPFRLRWERHTEFSTYTLFRPIPPDTIAAPTALQAVPADWLAGLPGEMIAGVHLTMASIDEQKVTPAILTALFGSDGYVGSEVSGGAAVSWTDFRLQGDGFTHMLLVDRHMGPRQAGRIVQRLLEIETYRMTALMALPVARGILPQLRAVEERLSAASHDHLAVQDFEGQRRLLGELIELAAFNERIAADTAYRFGAAQAYYAIVERSIAELRERRIEGHQTVGEFMERRLAPAMRTCRAVSQRHEALSARISRASALLGTRVNVSLEEQNRTILHSMDKRADLQFRLQRLVERLSMIALAYYLTGLSSYAAKGLAHLGLPLDPDIVALLMIPAAFALVWGGMHWMMPERRK